MKLPPLPFLLAGFIQPCHDLLLEVGNREALEALIPLRRLRGREKLHSLSRKLLGRGVGGDRGGG